MQIYGVEVGQHENEPNNTHMLYSQWGDISTIGENCVNYESATSEAMAMIWIWEIGRQAAKELDLKEAEFDFLLTYGNDI